MFCSSLLIFVLSVYLTIFFYYHTDAKDIVISGYVYDSKTHKSMENVDIIIYNERYTSDSGYCNYDEYLGSDTIVVKTNHEGYYALVIPKSAQLRITGSKNYYKTVSTNYMDAKSVCQDFYLSPK